MRYSRYIFASFLLVFCQIAFANIRMEVATNGGYTGNMLSDSSKIENSYSAIKAAVNFYPHSKTELNLNSDYTYYGKMFNLSNLLCGAGIKYIPTDKNSRLTILVNAAFAARFYRTQFESFNNTNYDAGLSVGFKAEDNIHLRTGLAYNSLQYTNFNGADKNTLKLFAGINLTLPWSNSLDLESGFASMGYRRFGDTVTSILKPLEDKINTQESYVRSLLVDDNLHSIYISPRFSRPIGSKTGFNITYTYRKFSNFGDKFVNGFSTGFLSPWASVYDGQAISMNIKTLILNGFTVTGGAGYWDKNFFKTVENGIYYMVKVKARKDSQSRFYLNFQRPFVLGSGITAEPVVQFDYTHNNSTLTRYQYSSLNISAGITFRL